MVFLLVQFPFLLPLLRLCDPVPVASPRYSGPQEPALGPPQCPSHHTHVQVVRRLNHSLGDFCNLLVLGKSFEVTDRPLERLLADAIHILPGDVTSSPAKVPEAVIDVIDVVVLPELHHCFPSCSQSLGKGGPQAVSLESC